jgi:hypothetical protein
MVGGGRKQDLQFEVPIREVSSENELRASYIPSCEGGGWEWILPLKYNPRGQLPQSSSQDEV